MKRHEAKEKFPFVVKRLDDVASIWPASKFPSTPAPRAKAVGDKREVRNLDK
jgi:hypothetical protein